MVDLSPRAKRYETEYDILTRVYCCRAERRALQVNQNRSTVFENGNRLCYERRVQVPAKKPCSMQRYTLSASFSPHACFEQNEMAMHYKKLRDIKSTVHCNCRCAES